ncbi:hypothetical protein ABID42_004102 [Arcicella rosea]
MYIALGFALNVINSSGSHYKEVEMQDITKFGQVLKIHNAVLREIILC